MFQLSSEERAEPLVKALIEAYRRSSHGRTGSGSRDFSVRYEKLVHKLATASVAEEKRGRVALERLRDAGLIRWDHVPLQRNLIKTIYVLRASEAVLFRAVAEEAPSSERTKVVSVVQSHLGALNGHAWEGEWKATLQQAMDDLGNGRTAEGLPNDSALHNDVLSAASAVLNNHAPILVRRLSAQKLGDSKLLKKRRESVERFLAQFLPPDLSSLEAWHVADTPPMVLVRGPLGLVLDDRTLVDELATESPYRLKEEVLSRANSVFTSATRCFCIENLTTFVEAAALNHKDILVHTSYPSSTVIKLLKLLPHSVRIFHWGDTDPWGYDILRVLRERSGRPIHAWKMNYRPKDGGPLSKREVAILSRLLANSMMADVHSELALMKAAGSKGDFEQESLPVEELLTA